MDQVLHILKNKQLYVKKSKCACGKQGHIVSREGVNVDPQKIEAIIKFPIHKKIKSFIGFLDLTGYYKKFVQNYECIERLLTSILKKNSFVWNEEATLRNSHS